MKKLLLLFFALLTGVSGVWAYSTTTVTSAQDPKGNALVSGAFYRILLPSRGASVALQQNGEYVKANNGLGIIGFMWKIEEDANGKALISNPAGGYWKFTDYEEGNSKVKTNGTSSDCTAFQMAWSSSANKTLNLFDPAGGSYSYDGVTCGAVLSNHGGVGKNMGIYNNILDGGSIFKFERFYRTIFTVATVDVNGVAVENYPTTVTINGNVTASEYYTNEDNQITSFSTVYGASYFIDGVEKTAEEVKAAINANTGTLTVTVKPQPFVASTNETPAYYAMMISRNNNSWFENTNGSVVNCGKDRSIPTDVTGRSAWIWELKQNGTNGYRIYNVSSDKYLGGRTATGGAFTLGDAASANSFISVYNSNTSVYDDSPTIKFKDQTNNLWIDRATVNNIGQPYAHTSGQEFTLLRMYKVTFSEAITVNSVDNVTTIYVKSDGNDLFTLPNSKLYSINGADAVGHADAEAAIAACSSNLTVTVSENTSKDVTYILKWSDGTTINPGVNVTTQLLSPASDFVPSSFVNDFATLSYSPTEIKNETTEVTVTATWNGPFQISPALVDGDFASGTIWQVVQMHTYPGYPAEKWSWSYKSGDSDKVKPEQVLEYDDVTSNRLFCFVGDPYNGFKIYNSAAGPGNTLSRAGESDELTMASGDHIFTLHKSTVQSDVTTYFCLKPSGATNYANFDYSNKKIAGYKDADNGSTCWVAAPGQYYLDFIDGLNLDGPVGVVGTSNYFTTVSNVDGAKAVLTSIRSIVAANMYSNELESSNSQLNPVKNAGMITLTDGYYRFVNAYTAWTSTAPTIYYNSASGHDRIEWSVASNDSHNVNSIFKVDAATPSIYSPNAGKFMSAISSTVSGALADEAGTTVITHVGSAQYNIVVANGTMHTAGHSSGAGTSGNLTSWGGGYTGSADAWYIVPVADVDLTLNEGGDGSYYATMCLPFTVTLDGASAYTLTLNSGKTALDMSDAMTTVPAGTPVLLVGTTASAKANIASNTTCVKTPLTTTSLTGTFVDKSVTAETDYFLGSDGDNVGFYKWDGTTLKANRAYLTASTYSTGVNSSVKGFYLNWGDEDAIQSITTESQSQKVIYNLAGQRVQKVQKGLYIINGKKVVIK